MDANQQMTNRQKLVFYLMEKELSNEEVAQSLTDVAEAALEQFTNEAMAMFTEDDKKAIEAAPSGLEADELVKKFYNERSGKNAEERLDQLIEEQAISFMSDSDVPATDASSGASQ